MRSSATSGPIRRRPSVSFSVLQRRSISAIEPFFPIAPTILDATAVGRAAIGLFPLCANMSETAYPRDISEQGGEGIWDNHEGSRGFRVCHGGGRGAAQRA